MKTAACSDHKTLWGRDLRALVAMVMWMAGMGASVCAGEVKWEHKTLDGPNTGKEQTACIVCDIDKDGVDDFVVAERTKTPSLVWYKFNGTSWDIRVIDDTQLNPEAGGDVCDIDGDGDLDMIFGQDYSGNSIWWWENPYPKYEKPWVRRTIKNSGAKKHHDQSCADYDGDGKVEFVSWNQGAKSLLLFEIPENAKSLDAWEAVTIYRWDSGLEREGFPSVPVDIDGDGTVDIVGGGRWFKHTGGTNFKEEVIDEGMTFTQCAAGQLVEAGRPEVVFSPGDMDGDASWYEWDGGKWVKHKLRAVIHGHTCEIRDIDADGHADIMIGEMGNPGAGDKAQVFVWYGDGKGNFRETVAWKGQGIHEGKLGDLDGDGDLDILVKPYNHKSPRVDILLNNGTGKERAGAWEVLFEKESDLEKWQRANGEKPKWVVIKEDGANVLSGKEGVGMIWTKERYGDFVLDLEFKTEGNSGVFFRTDKMNDCVQTGFEMQVNRPSEKPHKNSCGSVYDALAPTKEMSRAGQWNHVTITAIDNRITIVMNGEQIIDMDVNQWDTAGQNPGGVKNKFRMALKDFKREGHIGFQDHGANVWYRNVRVKRL